MSLDSLPFEVTCLVASYLPCEDMLPLLQCNRMLHDTVIHALYKQDTDTIEHALRWLLERGFELGIQHIISRNNLDVNMALYLRYTRINTPLLLAVDSGHTNIVELLLRNGAQVNVETDISALEHAASLGDYNTTSLLLQHGAHVNLVSTHGTSPLGCALAGSYDFGDRNPHTFSTETCNDLPQCKGENELVGVIGLLLAHGADPHFQYDDTMSTCLHRITQRPWKSTEKLLGMFLDYGADLNAQNSRGDTPLHVSLSYDAFSGDKKVQKDFVELLLRFGADSNAQNPQGNTPLHNALASDPFSRDTKAQKEIVGLLLRYGADSSAQNPEGNTPLHDVFAHPVYSRDTKAQKVIVELLLRYGADLSAQNPQGNTPLHNVLACASCSKDTKAQKEIVELLLRYGADINAQNSKGNTPLHAALACNPFLRDTEAQKEFVELLLISGADVNLKNQRGDTPLGITFENAGVFELVLKPGASTRCRGKNGDTIISMLLGMKRRKQRISSRQYLINTVLIKLLLEHGACTDQIIDGSCPLALPAAKMYPVLRDLIKERRMAPRKSPRKAVRKAPPKRSYQVESSGPVRKAKKHKKPTKPTRTLPRRKAKKYETIKKPTKFMRKLRPRVPRQP
ncbi:unnamed protein product [Penicillium egyptiacum]|uniref:F-box domain-containing protein n=1 Tax=Penicillium egyptiacum TaxID=1303716 RepID=A0A9W4KR30_9EURO|nr:unnamed protein product [Penicillium egyptiacum]